MTLTFENVGIILGTALTVIFTFIPILKFMQNRLAKQLSEKLTFDLKERQILIDDIDDVKKDFEKHQLSCRAEMYLKFADQDKSIQRLNLQFEHFQKAMESTILDMHEKIDTIFKKLDSIINKLIKD